MVDLSTAAGRENASAGLRAAGRRRSSSPQSQLGLGGLVCRTCALQEWARIQNTRETQTTAKNPKQSNLETGSTSDSDQRKTHKLLK